MDPKVQLLIIGALISLVSSLIGYFIQMGVQALNDRKGKVKLYAKSVYDKTTSKAWGFSVAGNDMIFTVPLWLEIQNTKNKNEVVRNLNLLLINKGEIVANTIQASHYEKKGKKIAYGDDGAYSFLLNPSSIQRFDLYFMIKQKDVKSEFNQVQLSYYDTKDKMRKFTLFSDLNGDWKVSNNRIDDDWQLLK